MAVRNTCKFNPNATVGTRVKQYEWVTFTDNEEELANVNEFLLILVFNKRIFIKIFSYIKKYLVKNGPVSVTGKVF